MALLNPDQVHRIREGFSSSERRGTVSASAASERLSTVLAALSASDVDELKRSAERKPATKGDAQGVEHNVPLEPPSPSSEYLPQLYEAERDIGLRRESGANKLKRLKPRHKKVLALHLAGWPSHEIAAEVGMTVSWVSTIISDPLSQQIINNFEELQEEEFKRLRVLANDTLREAMHPGNPIKTRLEGVREFHRREASIVKGDKGETAEDVMEKILQRIEAENVQINIHNHSTGTG